MDNAEQRELDEATANAMVAAWDDLEPEMQDRIGLVRDMKRRGLTNAAIAKIAGCSPKTVNRDVRWLRKNFRYISEDFTQDEELGSTILLLQEIEDKSMTMADQCAMEGEAERLVNGVMMKVKTPPDYASVQKFFQTAIAARAERSRLLLQTGMLKHVPKKIEFGGKIDVSQLRGDDLIRAEKELEGKVIDITNRISRISAGNPLEEEDS